jgi:hypothetical protein
MVWALSDSVMVPVVVLLLTGVNVSVTGHTEPAATKLQLPVAVTVGSDDAIEQYPAEHCRSSLRSGSDWLSYSR